MITLTTIPEARAACEQARVAGRSVGLVPTMGYFHEGHRSLMRAARAETGFVVVTLFVNPTQFGPTEDLDSYPRDPAGDTAVAIAEGADVLFAPSTEEMYPAASRTTVHVAGLTEDLCGAARPTHFDGVTTVVTKLLSIVGSCRAYFGRKDAQQLAVVRRMAADLNLPVEVVGCPLVREADGLAISSRNAYLTVEERGAATVLSRALSAAADAVRTGERDPVALTGLIETMVAGEPLVGMEYAEVRGADDLSRPARLVGDLLVAVAARVGSARLIDNISLQVNGADVNVDLGVRVAARGKCET
ncbi:MAG: pantoate--beta-alanine ligase [Acidimicrobiia bacterium]